MENFVRLYVHGYVGVAHEARSGGGPSVTDGEKDGAVKHSPLLLGFSYRAGPSAALLMCSLTWVLCIFGSALGAAFPSCIILVDMVSWEDKRYCPCFCIGEVI